MKKDSYQLFSSFEEQHEIFESMSKTIVCRAVRSHPSRQLRLRHGATEPCVTQNDGTKIVPVSDNAPHGLVHGSCRLLSVPFITR